MVNSSLADLPSSKTTAKAVLKSGTKITLKATKTVGSDIWRQLPSGWIALYYDGAK